MDSIIVKITNGLGNQMFQYAVGRCLSLRNTDELRLDISAYEYYKLRDYSLDNFNLNIKIASNEEISKIIKSPVILYLF